jgi:hypothetical protein
MAAGQTVVWDHLRMDPQEDPEARIRQLEQPLANTAQASELGTTPYTSGGGYVPPPSTPPPPPTYIPPPPGSAPLPPPTFGTPYTLPYQQGPRRVSIATGFSGLGLVIAGVVLAVMIGAGAIVFFTVKSSVPGGLTSIPSIPNISIPSMPSVQSPSTPGGASTVVPPAPTTLPRGTAQSVSGSNQHKTVVCNDSRVSVSGTSNTVTITGHCTAVAVSGIKNNVTLDTSDVIGASGVNNVVTYHSGSPEINAIGDNVVQQG